MACASVLVLLAVFAAGSLWQRSRIAPQPLWSGVLISGPRIAMSPRISPDGQLVAFLAMLEGQTQLGVMKPEAASWTPLTHERGAGSIMNLSWAPDGTKLYFDRFWDKPRGIYASPPLPGEPVLILENAAAPQALPEGSLIVPKSSVAGHVVLPHFAHRHWAYGDQHDSRDFRGGYCWSRVDGGRPGCRCRRRLGQLTMEVSPGNSPPNCAPVGISETGACHRDFGLFFVQLR
jgi:hypothetical protein